MGNRVVRPLLSGTGIRATWSRANIGLAFVFLGGCSAGSIDEPTTSAADEVSAESIAGAGSNISRSAIGNRRPPPPPPPPITPPTDPAFYIQPLGRMCVDFVYGQLGTAANLYGCNGTLAQQVGVREVSPFHDVMLLVNGYCVGARGGVAEGAILELETCDGSEGQEFALDGDSIIAGHRPQIQILSPNVGVVGVGGGVAYAPPISREYVVKPLNDSTAVRTSFALGTRQLTENEYLRLVATDGTNRAPHSGFWFPTSGTELVHELASAGWGTVIELLDSDTPYDVTAAVELAHGMSVQPTIQGGVTLRGNRKWTDNGPLITYSKLGDPGIIFTIAADDVRVTGLRFQGPSTQTSDAPVLHALSITDGYRVTLDHNELSHFSGAAVDTNGSDTNDASSCPDPSTGVVPPIPRPTTVYVARNFAHHNMAQDGGYGFTAGDGGFPYINGNVTYLNRHSLTSDHNGTSGYFAQDNLVLSDAPVYDALGLDHEQDFDVHGTDDGSHYEGGVAGDYVQVQYNTFLGTNRHNFVIRGQSCRPGLLDGNVFLQSQDNAIETDDLDGSTTSTPVNFTVANDNEFNASNPTDDLAIGDFDGDGVDDVFVGTGVGWYYSSGAQGEWRFLQRMTEHASSLRFGDFDGDGRTDVIAVHTPGTLDVSWGGVSPWQPLTSTPAAVPIGNFAVGNFDNDPLDGDDLFMTDGASWYIGSSGRNFTYVGGSSIPPSDLRFGDFDGDGVTDVFAINGGQWSFSSAARSPWAALGGPSTDDLNGVVVADFDGDGIADVGREAPSFETPNVFEFDVSSHGTAPFQEFQFLQTPIVLTGRFDLTVPAGDNVKPNLLLWWGYDGLHFVVARGASDGQTWSRQEMR